MQIIHAKLQKITIKINKELYDMLDKFELEDLSIMNEIDNHYEHSVLTEQSLNERAAAKPESLDEVVFQRLQVEKLHIAISQLPEIQQRRVSLYYFDGLTYEQIAKTEGCTKMAVKRSVDRAIETLKRFF